MRGIKDWRSVGGGGDGVDGVGGERGAGDGGVGVGDGGGGGVGGGGPSTLRVWKVGTPCLASVLTFRLPEVGGGEGWSWRGQGGLVVVAASAKEAWWSAARWLRRALALAPRCRRRLPGAGGKVGVDVDVGGEGAVGDEA